MAAIILSLPSAFPRAQQSASASRPAPSQGLQSCSWRPPAAASGCSPRGGSPVDPETVSGRDLLLACSPRAGPSGENQVRRESESPVVMVSLQSHRDDLFGSFSVKKNEVPWTSKLLKALTCESICGQSKRETQKLHRCFSKEN